jgi:hypothetical protein
MCFGRSVAASLGRSSTFATRVASVQQHKQVALTLRCHQDRRPTSTMMMVSVPASGAPTAQLRFYSSDKPSNIRRGKRGDEIARGVKKRTGTTGAKSSGALSGLRNQTPAQNNLEKAKLAVELAEGDARKERLRVSCLERVVAKARILTANEYVELLGTTDQNTMDYIREVTTIDPYTKKEAKQELEKAELKLKEAELKLEKAELKLEKAKLERGETLWAICPT